MSPCDNVKQLIQKLTLEEKVSLLSGADSWQSKEISRLGIGSFKVCSSMSQMPRQLPVGVAEGRTAKRNLTL